MGEKLTIAHQSRSFKAPVACKNRRKNNQNEIDNESDGNV